MNDDDFLFSDDPTHGIPYLTKLDVMGVKKAQGADLVIVMAEDLTNDHRTKHRILRKIENYIGHIKSADFEKECGKPNKENTRIIIHITADCDKEILAFLEQCRPWVELENDIDLEIRNP